MDIIKMIQEEEKRINREESIHNYKRIFQISESEAIDVFNTINN